MKNIENKKNTKMSTKVNLLLYENYIYLKLLPRTEFDRMMTKKDNNATKCGIFNNKKYIFIIHLLRFYLIGENKLNHVMLRYTVFLLKESFEITALQILQLAIC